MDMITNTKASIVGYKNNVDADGVFKGQNVYTLHPVDNRGNGYEPKEWYSKDDLVKGVVDLDKGLDLKKEYTLSIVISTFRDKTYTRLIEIK